MRAALITAPGAAPVVGDVDEPDAREGQVVVTVTAAAIAPIDRLVASGTSYLGEPPYPYTPGMQGVGVTDDGRHLYFGTGAGVAGRRGGSASQRCSVNLAMSTEIRPGLDITATALSGSAVAAVGALRRGGLRDGATVVVLGANGVVGMTGLQFAREAGARVVAVARGDEACARSLELGAAAVVDATSGDVDTIAAALASACPDGADLVLDPVWGAPALAALRVLVRGGRLVNLGESAGATMTLPSDVVRSRGIEIHGWTNALLTWDGQTGILQEVLALVDAGKLVAEATVIALDELPEAWSRSVAGRLVVVP